MPISQKSDSTLLFLSSAQSDIILQVKEADFGQILEQCVALKLFSEHSLKVFQN